MEKKEEDTYQFDPERTHQGLALVISNFTEGGRKREGSEADLKYMKKTFKRLGFKVDCHENVKGSEIVSLLNKCSQQLFTSYDCFVFAISSHGMELVQKDKQGNTVHQHAIEMFDGTYIYTKSILDFFSDRKCKALKGKPKLFFIQACRIPETKSTRDQYDAGIGFDSGISTHEKKGGQDQKTTRDKTDFGEISWDTETDSDSESDVSDTDVEEDESLSDSDIETTAKGQGDGKEPWQNLEKRQTEILKKLKRMEKGQTEILKKLRRVENGQMDILKKQKRMKNQVLLLRHKYVVAANQNKEPNPLAAANQNEEPSLQTTANQNEEPSPQTIANQNEEPSPQTTANHNEEPSLQASGNEDSNSDSAANENKETNPRNTSGVTVDQEDDIDPAKGRHLFLSESRGSGDDIDPPRGRKLYLPAPVEITLVPCHNDMLIMFASPQGHYAFRNKTDGSYMLKLLYKCVENHYANGRLTQNQTDFLDVLRDVTCQMSEMEFMGSKKFTNVPCVVHKLRKDVIFTQGNNMGSTKFAVKLSEIISTCGMSFSHGQTRSDEYLIIFQYIF